MNEEKACRFLEKLIQVTKDHKVQWRRYEAPGADPARSFAANVQNMNIYLQFDPEKEAPYQVRFLLQYDPQMPRTELQYENSECFWQLLVRLHTLVLSSFPSAEKAVDDFLEHF